MVPWPVEDCANEAHYIKEKSLHAWLSLDPLANRLLQSAALYRPVCVEAEVTEVVWRHLKVFLASIKS